MSAGTAWLLRFGSRHTAAIGEQQMLHLLSPPYQMHPVPASSFFCRHILVWEDDVIPVMDVSAWLDGHPVQRDPGLLGVAAYRASDNGETRRAALVLSAIPRRIVVSNDAACELPEDTDGWRQIALSCFNHSGEPVPVLNLARMFSGALQSQEAPSAPEVPDQD